MSSTLNAKEPGPSGDYPKPSAANCAITAAKLSIRGPDGRLQPAITGFESDAELRGIVVGFIEHCSASKRNPRCPFRILKYAYKDSLSDLMAGMTRAALLSLIEMEVKTRNDNPALCGADSGQKVDSGSSARVKSGQTDD